MKPVFNMHLNPCRLVWRFFCLGLLFWLAGCAHAPQDTLATQAQSGYWSGRLSLAVESEPAEHFAASFELSGNAGAGELKLYTPLGSTLAIMRWSSTQAVLLQGREKREFASVDELTAAVTGTALPVPVFFSWLHGVDKQTPGWHADLSQLSQGRLQALRQMPLPRARLKLVVDSD